MPKILGRAGKRVKPAR